MTTDRCTGKVIGVKYDTPSAFDALYVVDCLRCGFPHALPIPDTSIYSKGTYHAEIKPTMAADYSESCLWWSAVHSDWLSMIRNLAPNRFLLDVGAGTGAFVEAARLNLWITEGIEPDYAMAQRGGFFHGIYRDHRTMIGVGCISAHWVMEHLADPADFLSWAHETLARDGVLLVTIPNDFTDIQYRVMEYWRKRYVQDTFYWIDRTHVNYWNRKNFVPFLERRGFRVVASYGSWEPEKFILAGRDYVNVRGLGAKLHKERMAKELGMGTLARRILMGWRGFMGQGRDLTFAAVKV